MFTNLEQDLPLPDGVLAVPPGGIALTEDATWGWIEATGPNAFDENVYWGDPGKELNIVFLDPEQKAAFTSEMNVQVE